MAHRYEHRGRSRSPPRHLDYDDGPADRDRMDEESRYMEDGGYGFGDGPGTRKVRHHSDIDNRSGILNYTKYRPRSPPFHPGADQRRRHHDPEADYRHYGHDEYPVRPANHGEKDSAKDDRPNPILLVRGLKDSVTEATFAKGMEKLYAGFDSESGGATPKSIFRVLLIRDRRTEQRMGYGFVQYHTIDDAQAAVKKTRQMERNGHRLTISSKEFSISYAHVGVFPHYDFGKMERNEKFMFKGPQKMHKYNDDRYYPMVFVVNKESPHKRETPPKDGSDAEKKGKKSRKDTLENKSKKRKAPGAAPAYLDYYQKKQAELREDEPFEAPRESKHPKQPATGVNTISTTDTIMSDAPAEATTTVESQTFAHEGEKLIACYLCNSQFGTRDGVIRHLKGSAMHAKYLLDEELKERAYRRMDAKGVDPSATIPLPAEEKAVEAAQEAMQTQYRDRAAERRQEEAAAGVEKKVGFSLKGKGSKSSTAARTGRSSDSETEKGPFQPSYGKGLDMLQKAGWTAGQGIGAEGAEGIAAPIEANVYAAGVGLGHEGSKRGEAAAVAESATKGNGFLEMTRETARKRFEGMS